MRLPEREDMTEATRAPATAAPGPTTTSTERQIAPTIRRRMVLVRGTGRDPRIEPGDLAVLDRKSIGRKTLTRLVQRLVQAGASGLVLNDDVLSDLPMREREALGERLPLLVLGPEHPSTVLLQEPAVPPEPAAALRALLRGDVVPEPAGAADLDLSVPVFAVVVSAPPEQPLPIAKIEEVVAAEAVSADPRAAVMTVEGDVVSLLHGDDGRVEAAARAILHRLRSGLLVSSVSVGVGRAHLGADGVRRAYREARWAVTAGERLWGADRVTTFRMLGIYGMLEHFVTDPTSTDTSDVELLLAHDADHGAALVPTLESFFRRLSIGATAAELYVHRNTVTYRLRVVKRITGLDVLADPDAKLSLQVQLRVARLRGLLPARG